MDIATRLDVDVVAVEQPDQITVMLELTAPALPDAQPRPPAAIQVVLDRSGSMSGDRLQAAKQALVRLVDRLDPADRFGVVAFDDEVRVVVPAGPVADKASVRGAIAAIPAGGTTNLSAGLLRGLQEIRRVATDTGGTLLLLSDGMANRGETDPHRLSGIAASARASGITTSTIGMGLGYDETILAELARRGQGSHVFAQHGDDAAAAVAGEVDGLLATTVQAASLTIRPAASVDTVTVWNDLPALSNDGAIVVECGDLWAGETRRLTITFDVPAKPGLGLAEIAALELRWVALPDLVEHTLAVPVNVNVVPGDEAAGRLRDPQVTSEKVFLQVQEDKRAATAALQHGDVDAADRAYEAAAAKLAGRIDAAPSAELEDEQRIVLDLRHTLGAGHAARSAKLAAMDQHFKSTKRGRGDRGM